MALIKSARTLSLLVVGLGLAITQMTPLFAAASFRGVAGSYAASNGHLGGGADTLSNWTFEVWIRPVRTDVYQGLFDIHGDWKETTLDMGNQGGVGLTTYWPYTSYPVPTSSNVVTAGEWQLLAFVGDAQSMRAYRNGTLVGTGAPAPQIYIYGAIAGSVVGIFDFGLADYQTLPDAGFYAGSMADFRVWNRALTRAELLSHVVSQPATNAPGLVNWIPFDETTGTTFHDIVGGVTGTYYNVDFVAGPILARVDLIKAVKPSFSYLTVGTNYQLQLSADMSTWTNHGAPFTATNTSLIYPEYFDVENWGKLFFRLR